MFSTSLIIGPPTLIVDLIKTEKRIYNGMSEFQHIKELVKTSPEKPEELRKYGRTWGLSTLIKRWLMTLCNCLKIKGKINLHVLGRRI